MQYTMLLVFKTFALCCKALSCRSSGTSPSALLRKARGFRTWLQSSSTSLQGVPSMSPSWDLILVVRCPYYVCNRTFWERLYKDFHVWVHRCTDTGMQLALSSSTWQFPKLKGSPIDPNSTDLIIRTLTKRTPPIYRNSHIQ